MRTGGDGPLKVSQCLVQGIKICLKPLSSPSMFIQHPSQQQTHYSSNMTDTKPRALVLH